MESCRVGSLSNGQRHCLTLGWKSSFSTRIINRAVWSSAEMSPQQCPELGSGCSLSAAVRGEESAIITSIVLLRDCQRTSLTTLRTVRKKKPWLTTWLVMCIRYMAQAACRLQHNLPPQMIDGWKRLMVTRKSNKKGLANISLKRPSSQETLIWGKKIQKFHHKKLKKSNLSFGCKGRIWHGRRLFKWYFLSVFLSTLIDCIYWGHLG